MTVSERDKCIKGRDLPDLFISPAIIKMPFGDCSVGSGSAPCFLVLFNEEIGIGNFWRKNLC